MEVCCEVELVMQKRMEGGRWMMTHKSALWRSSTFASIHYDGKEHLTKLDFQKYVNMQLLKKRSPWSVFAAIFLGVMG